MRRDLLRVAIVILFLWYGALLYQVPIYGFTALQSMIVGPYALLLVIAVANFAVRIMHTLRTAPEGEWNADQPGDSSVEAVRGFFVQHVRWLVGLSLLWLLTAIAASADDDETIAIVVTLLPLAWLVYLVIGRALARWPAMTEGPQEFLWPALVVLIASVAALGASAKEALDGLVILWALGKQLVLSRPLDEAEFEFENLVFLYLLIVAVWSLVSTVRRHRLIIERLRATWWRWTGGARADAP